MSVIYRSPLDEMLIRGTTGGVCVLSNTYGMVCNNGTRPHHGWDLLANIHTPAYAIADGEVVFAGPKAGYGTCVILKFSHQGETLYALYGHLSTPLVIGGKVKRGALLGLSGNTGNAGGTPPHLHFEILRTLHFRRGRAGLLDRVNPAEILGGDALVCHSGPAGSPAESSPVPSPAPSPAPTLRPGTGTPII
jgi:murein DD-endopeptidase MepM/ murein hydrolase activator NlpD